MDYPFVHGRFESRQPKDSHYYELGFGSLIRTDIAMLREDSADPSNSRRSKASIKDLFRQSAVSPWLGMVYNSGRHQAVYANGYPTMV